MAKEKFIIAGAGIAGLTAAILLRELGYEAVIYESGQSVRGIGAGFGLASNAMRAFDFLGLEKEIIPIGQHLTTLRIVDHKGKDIIAADTSKLEQQLFSNFAIHRADLHHYLLAKIPQTIIHTSKKITGYKQENSTVIVFFEDGSTETSDYLIGADGVGSVIRQQMFPSSVPRYAGYVCWRSVIDNPGIQLETSIETWGSKGRFGLTPLIGNRIYWYACINASASDSEIRNHKLEDLKSNFSSYHSSIPLVLEHSIEKEIICNDIVDIHPLPYYTSGRVLLSGDAAHATTPNMGQGACMAVEDIAVLKQLLLSSESIEAAFALYNKKRVHRANSIIRDSDRIGKIAQLSAPLIITLRNFVARSLPDSFAVSRLKKLLETDFLS